MRINAPQFSGIFFVEESRQVPLSQQGSIASRAQKMQSFLKHLVKQDYRWQTTGMTFLPDEVIPDDIVRGVLLTEEDTVEFWRTKFGLRDDAFYRSSQKLRKFEEIFDKKYSDYSLWGRVRNSIFPSQGYRKLRSEYEKTREICNKLWQQLVNRRARLYSTDEYTDKLLDYIRDHRLQDSTTGAPVVLFKLEQNNWGNTLKVQGKVGLN